MRPEFKSRVDSRSDLLTLLSEACELEHGLACSYLYAAFSLKQDLAEGGLSWEQLHRVKKWAAQLYLVASQEMLHLAQAWNLLTALGGTPYYLRPNFPQPSKYYPLKLPLALEPFGERTMKRFILYEMPRAQDEKHYLQSELGFQDEDLYDYKTVGELYQIISDGLAALDSPELFIGDPALQMGEQEVDFPELVKVVDLTTAQRAIHLIMEQGEGTAATAEAQENCHFGIFTAILAEFRHERAQAGTGFQPVRPAISNPVVSLKGDYRAGRGEFISHEYAAQVADLFDDLYALMLRALHYIFSAGGQTPDKRRALARFAIGVMPMVVKPLGDALMQLPAGRLHPGKTAGPAFSMSRHVPLPAAEPVAHQVVRERLAELTARAHLLATAADAPAPLRAASQNLQRIGAVLDNLAAVPT